MLHTSKWFVAVAVVLLAGQACFAAFTADLTMTAKLDSSGGTGLANGGSIASGAHTSLLLTVTDTQGYLADAASSGYFLTSIHLNLSDSTKNVATSFDLATLAKSAWVWDPVFSPTTAGGAYLGGFDNTDFTKYSIGVAASIGQNGAHVTPSPFVLGTLTIPLPLYNGATSNTYTIALTGTGPDGNTNIDSFGVDNSEAFIDTSAGVTTHPFAFTMLPEPATMALMGLSGLVMFLRRRSR